MRTLLWDRLEAAIVHVQPPIGTIGQIVVVRYDAERYPVPVHFFQDANDPSGILRVQIAGRLVRQDDRRITDYRTANGRTLLLASGKLWPIVLCPVPKIYGIEYALNTVSSFRAPHAFAISQWKFDIGENSQVVNQVEGLKNEPDLPISDQAPLTLNHQCGILSVNQDMARSRWFEQAHDSQERRLPAPGRAGDRDVLPTIDA